MFRSVLRCYDEFAMKQSSRGDARGRVHDLPDLSDARNQPDAFRASPVFCVVRWARWACGGVVGCSRRCVRRKLRMVNINIDNNLNNSTTTSTTQQQLRQQQRHHQRYHVQRRQLYLHHPQQTSTPISTTTKSYLLADEEFCMQMDSHMDFVEDWDTAMMAEWASTRNE